MNIKQVTFVVLAVAGVLGCSSTTPAPQDASVDAAVVDASVADTATCLASGQKCDPDSKVVCCSGSCGGGISSPNGPNVSGTCE